MGTTVRHLLLVGSVGILVLFINLGTPPLWDRDEPRNAACAREMMERGDWVVPTFNGELRVLKPIMKYWLMISAYHLFGVSEFAARFWSAVFAIACAVATYFIGRRLFNPLTGLWSALILLTNLLFIMSGHLAKIDAGLTFFSMLSLLIYVHVAFPPRGQDSTATPTTGPQTSLMPTSWFVWLAIYAALGLAVLAKGLPGAVPAAVIGMFLLIVRLPTIDPATTGSRTWLGWLVGLARPFAPGHFLGTFWKMRPITAVLAVLAVAGPWYVLVGLRTDGEFLRGFFLDHHLGRAMEPMERHSGPFLVYYLVTILLGMFPWSMFLTAMVLWLVHQIRANEPTRYASLFLACWVGVYVVLFSCAQTKLPSYITPCFPGLALLLGALIAQLCEGTAGIPRIWTQLALASLGFAGLVLTVGLVVATYFIPVQPWMASLGVLPLLGGLTGVILWRRERSAQALVTVAASSVLFISLFFGVGLPHVGSLQQQEDVCDNLFRTSKEGELGYFSTMEPTWVFYAGQTITPLSLPGSPPGETNRWKATPVAADQFFARGPNQYVITTDGEWKWLKPFVPAGVDVVTEAPRFLRKGNWLVIGRKTADTSTASTARPDSR